MSATANSSNPMLEPMVGPSPVLEVAKDMLKRGALFAPVLVFAGAAIWGADGAASVAYGLAVVLVNIWLSAAIIAWTSKISLAMMQVGALFGFLIRLGLVSVAVIAVANRSWVDIVALGITIIVSHLGLLFWELRYISASLAYPGLKPGVSSSSKETVLS